MTVVAVDSVKQLNLKGEQSNSGNGRIGHRSFTDRFTEGSRKVSDSLGRPGLITYWREHTLMTTHV
jgi:hypothetical protein